MSELEPNADEMGSQLTTSLMLINAREELGLSQKDIADQLFLTTKDIRIIEEDLENFPRKAFLKGYLRSYARVVGISGEEVVACYNEAIDESEKEAESLKVGNDKKVVDQDATLLKPGLFGIAALIIVILLAWLLSDGEDQSVDEPVAPVIEQTDKDSEKKAEDLIAKPRDSSEPGVSEVTDSVDREAEVLGDEASSVTESMLEDAIVEEGIAEEVIAEEVIAEDVTIDEPSVRPTKEVDLERSQDRDVQYIIVRAGGEGVAEFFFEGECWLEVKDGEGDLIYSALNQSGDVLKILGIPPLDILFGKANAVRVEFNGEKVNLESRVRSDNTARLKLGG